MNRPRRMLIVTPLDYAAQPNNLEHHRAREYTRLGFEVTVVHKRMNRSARFRDLLRDSCTCGWRIETDGPVRTIRVDPFFNYFAGLRKNAEEGATRAAEATAPARSSFRTPFRTRLARLLAPLAVLRDLFFAPSAVLAAVLRGERYDVCLGMGPWGGLTGWCLRGLGRATVLVYEDRDFEPGLVPDRLRKAYTGALERFGIRRADVFVSIGELLAELRRAQTGRAADVIPSGVEWSRFAVARARVRSPSGADAVLVYVGNLVSWCGLEPTLRAMAHLSPTHPGLRLRIVGDGLPGYVARLRERVRELGLAQRVEFLGLRPPSELPELLAAADVGLANSEPIDFRRYASPLKLMEYLAAGLPVVTTQDTEAARIVERAGAGLAVPYEHVALARELGAMLGDAERLRALGARAGAFGRSVDWAMLIGRELSLIERHATGRAAADGALPESRGEAS